MADITVTAAKVAVVHPGIAEIYDAVASEAITAGQPVTQDATTGKLLVADANGAGGRNTVDGIALKTVGAGQACPVLKRGFCAGFTLSGSYRAKLYVSDTAGSLADGAGTASLPVGTIRRLSDENPTKLLFVDIPWN